VGATHAPAPEAYFTEDAARIAGSMAADAEAQARADSAPEGLIGRAAG
jgi:hypothetical protein